MRKAIRWAIICVCCFIVGIGLASFKGENEYLDFAVWLTGVMSLVILVGTVMVWALLENDEEEETEEEHQSQKEE